jgi:hypothetical protein
MANVISPKKKETAKILYLQGWNHLDIAEVAGINARTVSRIAQAEHWDAMKLTQEAVESSAMSNLMEVFVYQADCLKKMKDDRIKNQDFTGFKAGDFDAMQKFYSVIRQDMKNYKMFARVITDFLEYLELADLEVAKQVIPAAKDYLKKKQSALV